MAATSELAFAALVRTHGPMVLRVCRRGTRRPARGRGRLSSDVPGPGDAGGFDPERSFGRIVVARSGAARGGLSRSVAARRQRHERRRAEMTSTSAHRDSRGPPVRRRQRPCPPRGDRPLARRFRSALVLCYLEGLTHEMAADQLGCPVGTIRSRLATGRISCAGGLFAAALASTAHSGSDSSGCGRLLYRRPGVSGVVDLGSGRTGR